MNGRESSSMAATAARTQHPFHMYEAMHAQAGAFADVVERTSQAGDALASRLGGCERLYLVGIGTSYHAAQTGEHLVRMYGGGVPSHAVHAFDFALYGPPLGPQDGVVTISHRGTKRYTADALRRARDAGCPTVLITGEGDADGDRPAEAAGRVEADVVLPTVPQERSSAHTVSYVGAVAALAVLVARLGEQRRGRPTMEPGLLKDAIPAAIRGALEIEPDIAARAGELASRRRIWLVGGGPGAIAAAEGALKIKETSYIPAEGMGAEAMLHGPFQCTEPEDLFILIAPAGPSQTRVADVGNAVREIGAAWAVVTDGTATALREGAAAWWSVPRVPEPFAALTCVIPLQLLSYHFALARGTNPDGFRLEDPRFARAHRLVTL